MSTFDPGQADRNFEQNLLDTARMDVAPRSAEQAWADFTRAIHMAAANIEPASGVHRIELPDGHTPSPGAAGAFAFRAGVGKALFWLAVGALGGGALSLGVVSRYKKTAVAIQSREPERKPVIAAVLSTATVQAAKASPTLRASEAPIAKETNQLRPTSHEKDPSAKPLASLGTLQPATARTEETPSAPSSEMSASGSPSGLALEVRELDSIRRACRSGSYTEVIRLVGRYHREFPSGVLAPDADVLALEALAAQREYATLAEQTAAFLQKYPTDPHSAKVRRWAEVGARAKSKAAGN